jgi:hypothetical protein
MDKDDIAMVEMKVVMVVVAKKSYDLVMCFHIFDTILGSAPVDHYRTVETILEGK